MQNRQQIQRERDERTTDEEQGRHKAEEGDELPAALLREAFNGKS